ncbi:hypothetical protein PRUPE_3G273800 [Prunus persica]|uniref:AAA+ ATPase domain-containing protein n=1 Tax=Prunus persica TaxID=3760 RepID=M5XBQ8_PRUPE|nr:AAA-ATPase ASD, mitochondrial [Prunus persica]ONI19353.1 hypothetical protein PRUPE_3G273800 [Prunus persica]
MVPADMFAHLGSTIGGLMFVWAIFQQYFPYELRRHIEKYSQRLVGYVYPYIQITFNEFTGERLMRSEAYSAIENYLSSKSSTQAKRLKADIKNNQSLVLSMDDHEEVSDEFKGVKVWWASGKNISKQQTFSYTPLNDEKRYYKLNFHKGQRELIIGPYLTHVLKEGKAIRVRNRQRKLYTNNGSHWSHVVFEHPATFKTLAMEPEKKQDIIDDLMAFSKAEEFYASIGRAWKRGYLLYGPPGTGKSTMIAAMANLLGYDLYDLELTAVKDNTELRRLLIETSSKSIIVIEDIDCSLDLTGQRRKRKEKVEEDEEKDPREKLAKEERETKPSQVTLSGLLNFIDGLWSACRGERLIVFTTNYVEKLDAALIRKGRMDKHIELSYCNFESFKVLARNYLKLEAHHLFPKVRGLLEQTNMTPADVAEHLMPKSLAGVAENCLHNLIQALEQEIENGKLKAEEEGKEKKSAAEEKDQDTEASSDRK